jgi:hypothetical protein
MEPTENVELRLDLEWELWVIENLLCGATPSQVVDALSSQGTPRELAQAQVDAIHGSARFAKLRTRVTRAFMAEQTLKLRREISGPWGIDVAPSLSRDELYERYFRPSRPVLLTDALGDLPALSRWSFDFFRREHGDLEVEVNCGRNEAARKSKTEAESERVKLSSFIDEVLEGEGNARYIVSKNGLLARPELRHLEEDLAPLPDFLEPPKLPAGVALWLGPKGTFSPAHFDPHGVLLVQVEGTKRIRLVSPDELPLLEDMDGYYARPELDDPALHERPDFDPRAIAEATISKGQALFVPAGWFHEVTSLTPSLTLSFLTFVWDNHFHWLRPLSSR